MVQARYVVTLLGFLGTVNLYTLRLNLSVAIVDMTELSKETNPPNSTNAFENTSRTTPNNITGLANVSTQQKAGEKFHWNGSMQGLLLSSYFYGYIVTQVIGAYLGRKFGRVRVLGLSAIGSSALTLLFPTLAHETGYGSVVAARVLIGALSGVTVPILFAVISVWAPVSERSKLIAIIFAGFPAGSCIVLPLSGLLTDAFGWESVFYTTGALGLLWAFIWLIFVHESPASHPRISHKERMLILKSTGRMNSQAEKQLRVPWLSILTSRAWACLAFTHFASLFGKYQLMTMLPSYLKSVMDYDVKSIGILSSIPFLLGALLLFVTGPLADFLITRDIKSIYVRKILTTLGLMTSGVSIIVVSYIGTNASVAMILFTLSVAMDSLVVPGFKACIMEITPEFSGIAYGLSNTVSSLSGVLAPQITGSLRERFADDLILGWRISFWIGGVIYFLGAMVFLIFGTNKKQPWSYVEETKKNEELEQF